MLRTAASSTTGGIHDPRYRSSFQIPQARPCPVDVQISRMLARVLVHVGVILTVHLPGRCICFCARKVRDIVKQGSSWQLDLRGRAKDRTWLGRFVDKLKNITATRFEWAHKQLRRQDTKRRSLSCKSNNFLTVHRHRYIIWSILSHRRKEVRRASPYYRKACVIASRF